jgi:enterochelin esterase family protein
VNESDQSISKRDQAQFAKRDQVRVDAATEGDEPYELGTDSLPQPGTPRGSVTEYRLDDSQRFPGTKRRYWVYVPAQYTPDRPPNLMVFQDGLTYLAPNVNANVVFDNLIHRGEMPACVGVFVEPGDRGPGLPIWGGDTNRNVEYDTLSDAYAQFLLDELLPGLPVAVTDDAARRAICGISSGGICAFTAAWERPEAFGNAVSHCGSFVNIFGGHEYPSLIRRTERKPLRVFLQTGERDVDIVFGNWPIANRDMASALAYRGYEYELVIGEGGHTLEHGGAIFPDTMRWLWGRTDDRRSS